MGAVEPVDNSPLSGLERAGVLVKVLALALPALGVYLIAWSRHRLGRSGY